MRKRTLRFGVYALSLAVGLITVVTFFHEQITGLLGFSPSAANLFVSLVLLAGGLSSGCGVVLAVTGLFLEAGSNREACRLSPALVILAAVTFIFFLLFIAHFRGVAEDPLRPGETITI